MIRREGIRIEPGQQPSVKIFTGRATRGDAGGGESCDETDREVVQLRFDFECGALMRVAWKTAVEGCANAP